MSDSDLSNRETRPGILVHSPEANSPFNESDKVLLELKLEVKIGEGQVKSIEFAHDKMGAYVELEDESGIIQY